MKRDGTIGTVRPLRVVLTTGIFPPDIGGPATHSADLQEELSRLGHSVTVATLWDGSGTERRPGMIRFPRRWPWAVRLAALATWLVRYRHRYDVVYATGLHTEAVIGARIAGRPPVVKIVGDPAWERGARLGLTSDDFDLFQETRRGSVRLRAMRWARDWSVRNATILTSPSADLARTIEGWLDGPTDVRVIPNGVRSAAMDRAFAPDGDVLRAIFVGRLVPVKRVHVLLDALVVSPGVSLEVVGDGPERVRLQDRAREVGVLERVTFAGIVPHDEVLDRVAQSHVLLLVSEHEGLPHVAIESLACGVPLVALPVGGIRSILRDGVNGIALPDASSGSVARALGRLRDDAELRERLSDGARRSGADWGMDRCAAQVVEQLSRAVSGRPKGIFLGKSRLPAPVTEEFSRKLRILVRHLDPTIVGVGRPGTQPVGDTRLVRFPSTSSLLDGLLFYTFGPALAVSLAAGRRRCAIICQSPYEGFGVLLLARALPQSLRPPVVVEVHGDWRTAARQYGGRVRRPMASYSDRAAAWAIRRADRVRVVSGWLERLVRETGYGGDVDQFVAHIDMAEFLSAPVLPPPAEPRAAFVGALERSKGADLLVEAWSRVCAQVPGARLFIAGDGPRRASLVARCADLGINGSVEFLGHLPRSKLRDLLDRCSCLVMPSRSEGLGRVALEAMARARPVIAAKVGGLPELVDDERNGRLVEPEDPDRLASAVVRLFQDPTALVKMGQEGRRRALARDPLEEFESGISRLAAWMSAG